MEFTASFQGKLINPCHVTNHVSWLLPRHQPCKLIAATSTPHQPVKPHQLHIYQWSHIITTSVKGCYTSCHIVSFCHLNCHVHVCHVIVFATSSTSNSNILRSNLASKLLYFLICWFLVLHLVNKEVVNITFMPRIKNHTCSLLLNHFLLWYLATSCWMTII